MGEARGLGRIRLTATAAALALLAALAFVPTAGATQRTLVVSTQNGILAPFTINADGTLTSRGAPSSGGTTFTEGIAFSPDAKTLYAANFGNSSVGALTLGTAGDLFPVSGSPFTAGIASPLGVAPDPSGRWLFAWNHGSSINVSSIGSDGSLSQVSGSPFSTPTGLVNPFAGSVAPDGNALYVPNENNNPGSNPERVTAYSVSPFGALSAINSYPSGNPANQSNPFGSGITPDGKFLYVSNPEDGTDGSISGFAVNSDGSLTTLTSGFPVDPGAASKHPLNIAVAPDGKRLYVALRNPTVANGGSVGAYDIGGDGSLTPVAGSPFFTNQTEPKALAITPDGKRVYVSSTVSNSIASLTVAADGSLTPIAGSPFPTGITGSTPDLESIAISPNQPPTAAFASGPAEVGQPVDFDGSGSNDSDGTQTVSRWSWDFGDGTTAQENGPAVSHVYSRAGTYNVTLTVTDDEGCSVKRVFTGKAMLCNGLPRATTTTSVTVSADTTAPVVSSAKVSPRRFRRGNALPRVARARKGTRISFRLSDPARVTLTFSKLKSGRKVGGRCRAPSRSNRKRKRCKRYVKAGTLRMSGKQGLNRIAFQGRLTRRKRLSLGSYKLTIVATDPAGNRSKPRSARFRIVRR